MEWGAKKPIIGISLMEYMEMPKILGEMSCGNILHRYLALLFNGDLWILLSRETWFKQNMGTQLSFKPIDLSFKPRIFNEVE